MKMNISLRIEEAAIFLLCIFLFNQLHFQWWLFPAILFLPDVGMIGYLFNSKVGAVTYNLLHHRLVAAFVACYALSLGNEHWKLVSVILFAHISMDRALGYGLKYKDSFNHTHLGEIGQKNNQ